MIKLVNTKAAWELAGSLLVAGTITEGDGELHFRIEGGITEVKRGVYRVAGS